MGNYTQIQHRHNQKNFFLKFAVMVKLLVIFSGIINLFLKGIKLAINNTCGSDSNIDSEKITTINMAVVYLVTSLAFILLEIVGKHFFKIPINIITAIRVLLVFVTFYIHILQIVLKNYCGKNSNDELIKIQSFIEKIETFSFWMIISLILLTCYFILYMKYPLKGKIIEEMENIWNRRRIDPVEVKQTTSTDQAIDSLSWWMVLFLSIEIILVVVAKYTNNTNYALLLLG